MVGFTDVTGSAGIGASDTRTYGAQWGDYDNDGYADLFVGHHWGTPALYHNNQDGTFTQVVGHAGMASKTDRHGCAWGDFNADGFLDLYCATGARKGTGEIPNQLFKNRGNGTFTDVAIDLGVGDGPGRGRSVNWLDYNGDQHLDLYVGNTYREGFPSRLFRGTSGSFADVSIEAGVADVAGLNGSAWSDYDGDGDPDLLVMAWGRLILYQNKGDGTFRNVTLLANLDGDMALSGAWSDFDNDGDQDLFVARHASPATLYENLGNGTFRDITLSAGINVRRSRLGVWGDYDNDGDLDLFVVNDYNKKLKQNLPDCLFMNNGNGTFTDVASLAGVTGPMSGYGDSAAWADYNNDGFLDLFVTNGATTNVAPGPVALYHNNGNANHWLELSLRGSTNNTFAYGTKVWVTAGGRMQFRELTDGVVQYGQSAQIVHFGLGTITTADEIVIRWPNGQTQTLMNVASDQVLTIFQPGAS
jgi:hypothetical protein